MNMIDFLRMFTELFPNVDIFQLAEITKQLFLVFILSFSLLLITNYLCNRDLQERQNKESVSHD